MPGESELEREERQRIIVAFRILERRSWWGLWVPDESGRLVRARLLVEEDYDVPDGEPLRRLVVRPVEP